MSLPESENGGSAPSSRQPAAVFLRRHARHIAALAMLAVFILVAAAIFELTSEIDYHDIVRALLHTPKNDILLAILFTGLSFLALVLYDLNAIAYIGRRLPVPQVALTAFSAYAVGNTAGFGALSGGAIRYRAYSRLGLAPEEIAGVIAFVTTAFGLGLATLAALSLLFLAHEIGPVAGFHPLLLRGLAAAFLVLLGAALFLSRDGRALKLGRLDIRLPDWHTCLSQFLVSLADIAASAAVLYVLLPPVDIGWPAFVAIYAVAVGLGVLSHVPAGLGVFETVIIASLGRSVDVDAILGSLVLYRVIYHGLPLLLATILVSVAELQQVAARPAFAGLRRVAGRLAPPLLATFTFILGAVLIFSSVTPASHAKLDFLAAYLPLPLVEGAHFLASLLGLALIVSARGIGQRLDGAWWLTIVLALAALALSLLKAVALIEAGLLALLVLGLFLTRSLFRRPASLLRQTLSSSWLAAMAVILVGAGVILLFVYHNVEYSNELWWQFEFAAEAPRGLRALLGLAIASSAIAVFSLLKPVSTAAPQEPSEEALGRAVAIVERQDLSEANLVRMRDKRLMFSDGNDAFIMYGVQGRSWISLFGPIGAPEAFPELVWRFVEAARAAGCRAVIYQAAPSLLGPCADAGLRALKLGELSIVNLSTFDLKGGRWANLRQAAAKASREGIDFSVVPPAEVPAIMEELAAVSDAWLEQHKAREKGFSLGTFEHRYVLSQSVAVLRKDGHIVAFATILSTETRQEASVDLMRFTPDAPKAAMDVLFVRVMEHLRDAGFRRFNLGMAPLAGMSKRAAASVWDQIGGAIFEHGERFYNFKGVRAFKSKFHPVWEPRYLVVSGAISPIVAVMDATLLIGGGIRGVVGK
ncbi:MAG: bifunctional lysylphosphatidylglycerol flippase/synthetase MprF [Parvibaculaceae bacterium]